MGFNCIGNNSCFFYLQYFGVFDLMKTDFKVAIQIKNDEMNNFSTGSPPALNPHDDKFNISLLLTKSLASDALALKRFLQRFPSDRNQVCHVLLYMCWTLYRSCPSPCTVVLT
jgi:hypothetical protein